MLVIDYPVYLKHPASFARYQTVLELARPPGWGSIYIGIFVNGKAPYQAILHHPEFVVSLVAPGGLGVLCQWG